MSWGEWPETRRDNLLFLDDSHVSADDAAARFEVTPDCLEKWCRDHGLRAVWLRMAHRNPASVDA